MASDHIIGAFKVVASHAEYQGHWIVADEVAAIIRNENHNKYDITDESMLDSSSIVHPLSRHKLYKCADVLFANGNLMGVFWSEYLPDYLPNGQPNKQG